MTRLDILFALVSLLPAAVNPTPSHARTSLLVALCSGDGVARTTSLPLVPTELPGGDRATCCAKGCHSGTARKRNLKKA